MINVENKKCNFGPNILIGEERENLAEEITFDLTSFISDYGAGICTLLMQRPQDTAPYPVSNLTVTGSTAVWRPTDTDTDFSGRGQAQLVYTVGEVVAKSPIITVYSNISLGGEGDPPDPYESWLETLTELAVETQQSAQDAAASAQAAEQSAENAAESAQQAAESAASIEGDVAQAEEAARLAQAAQTAAETAQASAESSAVAASGSATAAAGSASSASASATAAESAAQSVDGKSEQIDQNTADIAGLFATKAPVIINTASGEIASFSDGADGMPVKRLEVAINPVQDGSGDPSAENVRPFVARTAVSVTRTGESLIGGEALAESIMAGMPAATIDSTAQTVTFTGRTNGTSNKTLALIPLVDGQRCTAILNGRGNISNIRWQYTDGSTDAAGALPNWGGAYVSAAGKTVRGLIKINNSSAETVLNYGTSCILAGVKTAGDFQPYQGEDIDIDWTDTAGAIYAGTLTLNADGSAELAALPHYASYNGEALVGPWASSMDVYAEGATPTVGAEVVDLGGEPTVYLLTDLPQLKTLYGVNNIWCDTGEIPSCEYPADTKLYIDQKIAAAVAALS